MSGSTFGEIATPHQETEEEEILKVASDLCQALNVQRFKPMAVSWATWLFTYRQKMIFPSDQCTFVEDSIGLQKALKGRLEPNEWKPLLASSLIYEFSPRIKRKLYPQRGVRFAIGLLAALGPIAIIRLVSPETRLEILPTLGYVLAVLFVYSTLFWDISLLRKKLHLSADIAAIELVGRESLFRTLSKLDAMKLSDVEERKLEKLGWSIYHTPFPSITQRLENLKTSAIAQNARTRVLRSEGVDPTIR